MKQRKHKSKRLLIGLALLLSTSLSVSAQTLSGGHLYGQATLDNSTLTLHGDLVIESTGELFLGSHVPSGQQINKLLMEGDYAGVAGAKTYHSVISNNNADAHGFIGIVGTATGSTEIVLDMFSGWNGSCIDLVRAYANGSNPAAFTMQEGTYNGHDAYLKTRQEGNDIVWYVGEKNLIKNQFMPAQNMTCGSGVFSPLVIKTAVDGNYTYEWYQSPNADGSNAMLVNWGTVSGGIISFTPNAATNQGISYYYCVVTGCSGSETSDISGAIVLNDQPKIHILGGDVCMGNNVMFRAEVYEGSKTGTGSWEVLNGSVASVTAIDDTTCLVSGIAGGNFTIQYHYNTIGNCLVIETSAEYKVHPAPELLVRDMAACSGSVLLDSMIVKLANSADLYRIYDSKGNDVTGWTVPAPYPGYSSVYYIEAFSSNGHCTATSRKEAYLYNCKDSNPRPVDNCPRITKQPEIQAYDPDETDGYVTFYVEATGYDLAYQWYEVGVDGIIIELTGETSNVLLVPIAELDADMSYYVRISGMCGGNLVSINSNTAYGARCLDLIIQKKNHTLMVNSNADTNGANIEFDYYKWYKNGNLVWENSHGAGEGGYYYTGSGVKLNENDTYYVIVKDMSSGRQYRSCEFNPVNYSQQTDVIVYSNPVSRSNPNVFMEVKTDDEELLQNGVITTYNMIGQYLGRVRTEGHSITPVKLPPVAGVYLLRFTSGDFERVREVIVE